MPPQNRRKNFRKRAASSESEDELSEAKSLAEPNDSATNDAIELAKQLKELRKRPRGLVGDVTKDSSSSKTSSSSTENNEQHKGGLIDLKSNFLAESQKGDIDRQMLNFIETELKKHRGESVDILPTKNDPEQNLFQLPKHLNVHSVVKGDDMMSQQMLEGIPEVDLGLANKIRNIEATEAVKQKLREEARQCNLQDATYNVKGFVPNNVTVNFVQHNRWDGEQVFKSLVPHAPTNLKKTETQGGSSKK